MFTFDRTNLFAVFIASWLAAVGQAQSAPPEQPDKLLGASRDLNAPLEFNADLGDSAKKTVLIYYANETAPDQAEAQNYERLIQWLESSPNPKVKHISESLKGDLDKFHKVVDSEIATITKHLKEHRSQPEMAIAVFTNRMTREGKFELMRSGQNAPEQVAFTVPSLNGLIYKANPLSHPIVFQSALAAVSQQFSPQQHQFVLVTKSHGGAEFVISPRVVLDVSQVERESLLARLDRDVAGMTTTQPGSGALKASKSSNSLETWKAETILDTWKSDTILATDARVNAEPLEGDPPRIGVSKQSYVTALLQVMDATGMEFPLLFIEACRSQLEDVEIRELHGGQKRIGRLYTSDLAGLQYTTLDYEAVFGRVKAGESLAIAMHNALYAKYQAQKTAREQARTADSRDSTHAGKAGAEHRQVLKKVNELEKMNDLSSNLEQLGTSRDTAFDRLISRRHLAEAWASLDSAGLADGALQTLEAERILGRPEPTLPASELTALAVRLALEKHDRDSLDRLEKGAAQAGRPELVSAIVLARKTAGPSRSGSRLAPVAPEDTDVTTFAAYRAFIHDIQAARVSGDLPGLDAIAADLDQVTQFSAEQRDGLRQQIEQARAMSTELVTLPQALDRLVAESRGVKWQWQGVKSGLRTTEDNNTSDFGIVEVTPARTPATGPALGRTGKSQPARSFHQLSYEQRQDYIRLLKNPNAFKPRPVGKRP